MPSQFEITYRFHLSEGAPVECTVSLDPRTMRIQTPLPATLPAWTALGYERCPNCTLDSDEHPCCPTAAHIVAPIKLFSQIPSFAQARVECVTAERTSFKDCTVAEGLSSLYGIYMTGSGCPVLKVLRPLVRYHMPFATRDETVYRAASLWLLGQYLREFNENETIDLSLRKLSAHYREIGEVNAAFARRIQSAVALDASLNAIVQLDYFAQSSTNFIENGLKDLRAMFSAWHD